MLNAIYYALNISTNQTNAFFVAVHPALVWRQWSKKFKVQDIIAYKPRNFSHN